jgi:UDP-3-O-[3-hydroxymyristoyl] glucosamine N-acyltransferase
MNGVTVRDLAARIGGDAERGGTRVIAGVATPRDAGASDLIFITSAKYGEMLASSSAGAALLPAGPPDIDAPAGMAVIRVADPLLAMARAIDVLVPVRPVTPGVSARAIVATTAAIHPEAAIGHGCVVGERTRIGARSEVRAGATIGDDVILGDDCLIHAGAHVYDGARIGHRVIVHAGAVIGADGFGYVREPLPAGDSANEPFRYRKIRQVGTVVIEDDVEIGANTTIDRAMLTETRVGRGTKIDNLVMVGHNCRIGRHCVIVSQAGLSGSVELGEYATIAGQVGIIGHVKVGDHAVVGSQAGVHRDVPAGTTVLGAPAVDMKIASKALPIIAHLPELRRLLRTLERRVNALEGAPAAGHE